MRGRLLALATALTVVLVACADATLLAPGFATVNDVTGPWRPTPLVLDGNLRERIAHACRRDMERNPASMVAIIDARGAGVAVVRMTGASAGACDALQITRDGQVIGAGGGWSAGGVEVLPAIGEAEINDVQLSQVGGGELRVEGWSLIGRAGPAIAHVAVETPDEPQILATLENGWFAAWWPADLPIEDRGEPPPQPRYVIRGFDAEGTLLAEVGS